MISYSTCRRCTGILQVTGSETTHPGCDPLPTAAERLAQEWLDAVLADDTEREAALFDQIEVIDGAPPRLLDAALYYARLGWPVFPLRPRDKRPATRNGFKDATTDAERIRTWWTRHPEANIGLPTGHTFDVIDVDLPHGVPAFISLLDTDTEVHGRVSTSSGGIHLYVTPTGGGNLAGIVPGIDYRGAGGYVVAPPSTLGPRGRAWAWSVHPSPVLTGVGDTYGLIGGKA